MHVSDELLRSLAALLTERRQPPVVLSLCSAVQELEPWLNSARPKPLKFASGSLRADIEASAASVPPMTRAALADHLDLYMRAVRRVTAATTPSAAERIDAVESTHVLLAALAAPATLRSYLSDLIAAAASSDFDGANGAIHGLVSAAEAAGHDPTRLLRLLAEILRNSGLGVAQASAAVSGRNFECSGPEGDAGLSVPERINLASAYLTLAPMVGHCVVWLTYGPGDLSNPVMEIGPVVLMEARWAIPNATDEGGQDFPHRSELAAWRLPGDMALDGPRVILVRVDLGQRRRAKAIREAREMMTALLDSAALMGSGSRWKRIGHEMLCFDGRPAEWIWGRPDRDEETATIWDRERTSLELEERGPHFATALASGELPSDLAEAIRSAMEVKSALLRSRIVLNERVVEMVAAYSGLEAAALVDGLIASWAEDRLQAEIHFAVHLGLSHMDGEESRRVHSAVLTSGRAGTYRINLDAVAEHAVLIGNACIDPLRRTYVQHTLATITDPQAYLTNLEGFDEERRLLRTRLRRARNALTHGNPVTEEVIASVRDLSGYLASRALRAAVEAFMGGYSIPDQISLQEAAHKRTRQWLREGKNYLALIAAPLNGAEDPVGTGTNDRESVVRHVNG